MSNLLLESLEIHNFRGLRELRIEKLGRVNLIVGKNNTGKTSVLEALRLYAQPGSPGVLADTLAARNELGRPSLLDRVTHVPRPNLVDGLFYGRRVFPGKTEPIRIGPLDSSARTLSISLELHGSPLDAFSGKAQVEGPDAQPGLVINSFLVFQRGSERSAIEVDGLSDLEQAQKMYRLMNYKLPHHIESITFVSASGLLPSHAERLWDSIALTSLEEDVIGALRIITPEIERVSLISNNETSPTRVAFSKIRGDDRPIPLSSLGDGVNRLFGMALALVNARDGLLLIDEFENGIHYTVQPDVWRLIFQTAQKLNVQVFATTHSFDCIKAFEEAARESEEKGVLIRLAQKAGRNLVAEFDERELEIATQKHIEIR